MISKAGRPEDGDGIAALEERYPELREPDSPGACASCGSYDACQGGCMAAKFFTGLPLDGPDPECVEGYGAPALAVDRDECSRVERDPRLPVGDQPAGEHRRNVARHHADAVRVVTLQVGLDQRGRDVDTDRGDQPVDPSAEGVVGEG